MAHDSTELKLTREEALKLHRQMWTDMQVKLGDCPDEIERYTFKSKWCERWLRENGFPPETRIRAGCFLCEYADIVCQNCPIDWSKADHISTRGKEYADCTDPYIFPNISCGGESYYKVAHISEILALPERDGEQNDES